MPAPHHRYRSKTVATWLALLGGALGADRFYLHGWRDPLGWLYWPFTLAGLVGVQRMRAFGQDDRVAWILLPLLGLALSAAMLSAIVHGLSSDANWAQRHNPLLPPRSTGWLAVLGVVAALALGAIVLISTIAFSVQRVFEWQPPPPAASAPR